MSERERLIKWLGCKYNCADRNKCLEEQADYLLENGVIVPPVKIGQTVYHFGYSFIIKKIEMLQDEIIYRCGNLGTDDYMAFCESDIGKTVFLTKEQAEKELKGGAE